MTLTKEHVSKVIALALAFLIGLLAVFGYDVGVIQPRERVTIKQATPMVGTGSVDCAEAP